MLRPAHLLFLLFLMTALDPDGPDAAQDDLTPSDLSKQEILPLALKYRKQLENTIQTTPTLPTPLEVAPAYVCETPQPDVPLPQLALSDPLYAFMSLQL